MQSRIKHIILEEIKKQLGEAAPIYIDLIPGEGYTRYYKGPGNDEKPAVQGKERYKKNGALGVSDVTGNHGWVGQPGGAAAEFGRSSHGISRGPEFKTRKDLAMINKPRKPKNLKEDTSYMSKDKEGNSIRVYTDDDKHDYIVIRDKKSNEIKRQYIDKDGDPIEKPAANRSTNDDPVTDNGVIPKSGQRPNDKHNKMYNRDIYSKPASSRDQGRYVGSDLGNTRLKDKTSYLYLDMLPAVAKRNRNIRQYLVLNNPAVRIKDPEGRVLVPFKTQTDNGTKIVVRSQYKGSHDPKSKENPNLGNVPDTDIANTDLQKPLDKKAPLPVRGMKSDVESLQTIYSDLAHRKNLLKQYLFDAGVNVGNLDKNINTSDVSFDQDELTPIKTIEEFEDSLEDMSKSKLASNYEDIVLKMYYIIKQVKKADTKVNALKNRGDNNRHISSDLSI